MKLSLNLHKKTAPVQNMNLPQFNRIVHLSDVHVRPLNRHDEYNDVFNRLYSQLNDMDKDFIIVITGDIFDSKHTFKPETFRIIRQFLKNLAGIAHTIVIPGNHDMIEKNTDRLDAISPVTEDIPHLHYLIKSGVYVSDDKAFVTSSLYDKQFVKINDLSPDVASKKLIYLYHGTVVGSSNDHGFIFNNASATEGSTRYRELSDFDGFNYVLLGDIHKRQFVKPHIGYAGSLIQQNHGETSDNHGFILWDLINDHHRFVDVHNDHKFVTITFKDGIMTSSPPRDGILTIRAILDHTNNLDMQNTLEASLKDVNYQICSVKHISDKITPLRNHQTNMDIQSLIHEELEHDPSMESKILQLHQQYQNDVDDSNYSSAAIWKPVWIKFNNMFGYNSDVTHHVNFMDGSTNLLANNRSGKTSLIKTICFAVFGRASEKNRGASYDVVNNGASSAFVNILIEYGRQYYLIERNTVRKHSDSRNKLSAIKTYQFSCNIFEADQDGNKIKNLSSIKKNNNDTLIAQMFGSLEEFEISCMLDRKGTCVTDMKERDLIERLKTIFNLQIFDKYKTANEIALKENKKIVAELQNTIKVLQQEIKDDTSPEDPTILKETSESLSNTRNNLNREINHNNELITQLTIKLNDAYNSYNGDVQQPSDDLETINRELSKYVGLPPPPEIQIIEQQINFHQRQMVHVTYDLPTITQKISREKNQIPDTLSEQEITQHIQQLSEKLGELRASIVNVPQIEDDDTDDILKHHPEWTNAKLSQDLCQRDVNNINIPPTPSISMIDAQRQLQKIIEIIGDPSEAFRKLDEVQKEIQQLSSSNEDDAHSELSIQQVRDLIAKTQQQMHQVNKPLVPLEDLKRELQTIGDVETPPPDVSEQLAKLQTTERYLSDEIEAIKVSDDDIQRVNNDMPVYRQICEQYRDIKYYQSLIRDVPDLIEVSQEEKQQLEQLDAIMKKHQNMVQQLPPQQDALPYIEYLQNLLRGQINSSETKKMVPPIIKLLSDYSDGFNLIGQINELSKQINDIQIIKRNVESNKTRENNIQSNLQNHQIVENIMTLDALEKTHDKIQKLETLSQQKDDVSREIDSLRQRMSAEKISQQIKQWEQYHQHESDMDYLESLKHSLRMKLLQHMQSVLDAIHLQNIIEIHQEIVDSSRRLSTAKEKLRLAQLIDIKHNRHINEQISQTQQNIQELKGYLDAFSNITRLEQSLKDVQQNIKHSEELDALRSQLEHRVLLNALQDHQIIKNNKDIHHQCGSIRNNIKELKSVNLEMSRQSQNLESQISEIQNRLNMLEQKSMHAVKISEKIDSHSQKLHQALLLNEALLKYHALFSHNGLPKKILYKYLDGIQTHVNNILEKYTHYTINIGYDHEKNSIFFLMINPQQLPITLKSLSGMESVLAKIAIKNALNCFSHNARSDIFIVDEALDSLDSNNVNSIMPDIIQQILSDFSQLIVISQHDVAHLCDYVYHIDKNRGVPRISLIKP